MNQQRIDVLNKPDRFSILKFPHVSEVRLKAFARRLVRATVLAQRDYCVAAVDEFIGHSGKAIPFRS